MLEIASFRRTPRYLKDLLFCPSLKFSKRSLLQRHFDSNVLCRCCACAFVAGRRPDGPRPMAASPAPTALRAAVTRLASIVGTLGYAVPSGTCSYYSTQKRSVIVKAIFQEGPPFRAGRRSMREDKTAVLQRPFCAFQGGLRFKAATALA